MSTQVRGFLESLFFIKVNLTWILKYNFILNEVLTYKNEVGQLN